MLSARSRISWLRETLEQNLPATVSFVILAFCAHHVMVFRGRANFPENFVFTTPSALAWGLDLDRNWVPVFPGEVVLSASTASISRRECFR